MDTETRKEAVQKMLVSVPDYMQKVKCDTKEWTAPFKCAVRSCRNFFLTFEVRDKYTYKFHNFPSDQYLCNTWKQLCDLPQDADISRLKVCSDHFSLDDYVRNYKEEFLNPEFKRKLRPDALPTKNLISDSTTNSDTNNDALLDINGIKEAVDENNMLRIKYEILIKEKSDLTRKIAILEKKNAFKAIRLRNLMASKYSIKNKNIVRKVFSDAQINLLLGKRKVFWSDDDLAKAFILRHIGSKECYLYLKNQLNMPLPALACIQKWAASYNSNEILL